MKRAPIFLLVLLACGPGLTKWEKEEAELKAQAEYEKAKALDRYYELEFVKCVNDLGIDRCKTIQETGFHQCLAWKYQKEAGIVACAQHRIEDRLNNFTDGPLKPEAEDPVPQVEETVEPTAETPMGPEAPPKSEAF